jgi:hypothetical protein
MCGAMIGVAPRVWHLPRESEMEKVRKDTVKSEPLGIIISRGDKTEPTPVFCAYIWGPVPENSADSATKAA